MYDEKLTGFRLRKIREMNDITQEKLGGRLSCKHNSISRWENGQRTPSLQMLFKLSDVYKIKPSDFFTYLFGEENSNT